MIERSRACIGRAIPKPMGEGGKGERSDARTFRRIGRNQKSVAGESGIYPARFSNSSLFSQENLSSQKNARPFQLKGVNMSHGINVSEQATSVKSMVAGDSAIPVIFGTAPVNMVENPSVNEPVLCLNYAEAVKHYYRQ